MMQKMGWAMKIIAKILLKFVFYKFGGGVKVRLLRVIARHVGKNVAFGAYAQITHKENLSIGDSSGIPIRAWFDATGGISIGCNVMIGHETMIFSANHGFNKSGPLTGLDSICKEVIIHDNCWIGARCIILPGVEIAEGVILGAGSVVAKSLTEKNSIYAGNPAIFKKNR